MKSRREIQRKLSTLQENLEMVGGSQGRISAAIRTLEWVIGKK